MANVKVYDMKGSETGTMELNDEVFGVEVNTVVMHRAVLQHLANRRQGTQSAKTRAEVSGGGRKPWKQKGTGHARQGSTRSPQWKGGGVVFAPKPRDYSMKMNKKEKALAIKSALTTKVLEDKIFVIDDIKLDEKKTKKVIAFLDSLKVNKALIVTGDKEENVVLSARNIPNVATAIFNTINVFDLLKYDSLIISKDAVTRIQDVYVSQDEEVLA